MFIKHNFLYKNIIVKYEYISTKLLPIELDILETKIDYMNEKEKQKQLRINFYNKSKRKNI